MNKNKENFESIVKNMNYEIVNTFKQHSIKYYDMSIIETSFSIIGAFWEISKNNKEDVKNSISNYIEALKKHSILNETEIEEIELRINNNLVYIKKEIINNSNMIELFNKLVKLTIECCTDETYLYSSQVSIEIINIIINNINLIRI